jgi:hypothetical protein
MRYALAAAAAIIALPSVAAPMPKADASGATQCEVHGYLTDTDPKGTNVRAAPDAHAAVIGHLPPEYSEPTASESFAVEFTIIGSKNGWLLIKAAETGQYGDGPTKTVFAGPGWISGALVGFTIGSNVLRSGPAKTDKEVVRLIDTDKGYGPDSYAVKRVHACQGHAVEVTAVLAPSLEKNAKPVRGWARHVCANQVTTCDTGGDAD